MGVCTGIFVRLFMGNWRGTRRGDLSFDYEKIDLKIFEIKKGAIRDNRALHLDE